MSDDSPVWEVYEDEWSDREPQGLKLSAGPREDVVDEMWR